MNSDELKRCLKHLNISPGALQKLIGCRDLRKMSQDNARCIRALVLKRDVRELVFQWRSAFPDLEFTAIRAMKNDEC